MSNVCIICLEDSNRSDFPFDSRCQCNYLVHSKCFYQWRYKQNICLLCRQPLNALPFHVNIFRREFWSNTCKIVLFGLKVYCMVFMCIHIWDIVYEGFFVF